MCAIIDDRNRALDSEGARAGEVDLYNEIPPPQGSLVGGEREFTDLCHPAKKVGSGAVALQIEEKDDGGGGSEVDDEKCNRLEMMLQI